MQYFNFAGLIRQYSKELTAYIPAGESELNDKGIYEKPAPKKITFSGAIISHRQSKIFRSAGTLTGQDRALYMLEPLEFDLQGAFIVDNGKKYHVGDKLENAEFTGVYNYTLKYQSAFDEQEAENG